MKSCAKTECLSNLSTVGYTPAQIKKAYQLQTDDGQGVTATFLSYFQNPYLQKDLDAFCKAFDIETTQIHMYGECVPSAYNFNAYIEPVIDTQWFHAIAPKARMNIVCVEQYNVFGAIDAIRRALEIGTDLMILTFETEMLERYREYEDVFASECLFIASAGDTGAQANFPAGMPGCLAVGGTTLFLDAVGNRLSYETVWKGSGGGIAQPFDIPDYQKDMKGVREMTGGKKGIPDVSFLADPHTGVSVYHSSSGDAYGWYKVGGTSISAPIVGGILAGAISKTPVLRTDVTGVIRYLYDLAGGSEYTNAQGRFYDVIYGTNGAYEAGPGYDLCTGLGSLVNW